MKVSFLIHNVFGVGGTNRAVINLSSELSRTHDVEIVSIFRRLDRPMLDIPAAVRVRALVDTRPGSPDREDPQQRQRSAIVPGEEEFYATYSRLTDARLQSYLETSRRDVYIGTRPALNLAVARWAPASAVRIAQEHQTHATIPAGLRTAMQEVYGRLSAAVTVTETDAEAFRQMTPVPGLRIWSVPNSSPASSLAPADASGKIIMAAGRLDRVKQYDVLIHAFRAVVEDHPDWSLRIYGAGSESGALRGLISALGLNDHALLMGRNAHMETEWVKGAMLVSSSERESFGMSIVEAMQAGLPVVSTRAPVGPEEIISDGVDGLLVPVGDVAALAKAMNLLVEQPDLRAEMGQRARENATRFDPSHVARRYDQIFEELSARARGRRGLPRPELGRWGRTFAHSLRDRVRGTAVEVVPQLDVTVEPSGALRFDGQSEGTQWARLVLVDRASRAEVGVELACVAGSATEAGAAAGTAVRGWIAADTDLPEGRWNVSVELRNGRRIRVAAGLCDTRAALSMPLQPSRGAVVRRLPYETADHFLAVRAWLRPHHAEVDTVQQLDGVLRMTGRLVVEDDAVPSGPVRLVAASRRDDGPRLELNPVDMAAGRFELTLDLDELAGLRVTRHDDWDLYLDHLPTGSRARVARLADDIADRKPVVVYDYTRCIVETDPEVSEEFPRPTVAVRPYITVDSDLSLYVRER